MAAPKCVIIFLPETTAILAHNSALTTGGFRDVFLHAARYAVAVGQSVKSFAVSYDPSQRDKIRFAWNGKHATDFKDDNLEFRKAVVAAVLSEPEKCPVSLISDLLKEEALCSREAWGAPPYFSELLTILLRRGGREYLKEFAVAMMATFDTFGASHAIGISSQEAKQFLGDVDHLLVAEPDKKNRALLESAKELFEKIMNGNAAKGWAVLPPGTPVKDIKIVKVSREDEDEKD